MIIATAIISRITGSKLSYGPSKLVMCLLLFLHIRGACMALGIAIVTGIIFALVCKAKNRKISLAPAISIGCIAALLLADVPLFPVG